ncbi:putative ferric-chelate reductase NDAI_0D05000 [Naumovozyma dairenensis CBS 421]|uniref:FAD-binding FR-type domain-containing protein n=1 Tax=Naumovozyma dairenensis (strain ATCC 10597 / BCRC 20456 / CBS 421 / NBRC 0211 / NRRL Y-12639) TaxID=1071378 RepID=G0WAK2_NAUDC|nr:hypothetical protein NDAI_0D05000 [Naumovozyma dairenensis CBS 421]CCD24813.1 hypothetical protein NDAI_0D05000 [Naumovozyma dairenensis CBS 421]
MRERFYWHTPKKDVWEKNSVMACASYLTKLDWNYKTSAEEQKQLQFYSTLCDYKPALGSWSLCIYGMLNDKGMNPNNSTFEKCLESLQGLCSLSNSTTANLTIGQYHNVLNNATRFAIPEPTDSTRPIEYPVAMNQTFRSRYGEAFHTHAYNLDISNYYGLLLCSYFLFVLLVASCFQYWDRTGFNAVLFKHKFFNYIRGHFLLPTLLKNHANYTNFKSITLGLFPTRLETAYLFGYQLTHLIFICIDYNYDPYNLLFKSKSLQRIRFFADRTGIMAFAQLPLIILFSTRNNIFEYFTGFKYSTFIMFHKWIGRTMVLDLILHAFAYTIYAVNYKNLSHSSKQSYFQFGIVACFIAILMIILSIGLIRKNFYETFLYSHIILAILFFYSCWKHVEKLGWKEWIFSSLAIWAMERIFRLIQLLNFGAPLAKFQLYGKDLIRITIPKTPKMNWNGRPGQYGFLYVLHPLIFWQSHPFTFIDADDHLIIVARAKTGATHTIFKQLVKQGGSTQFHVSIEGPYGTPTNLHHFTNVLLLAGGSGLPGLLDHASILAQDALKSNKIVYITLILVVRGHDILKAFKKEILALKPLKINLIIYDTALQLAGFGEATPNSDSTNSFHEPLLQSTSNILKDLQGSAIIYYKRPNLEKVLSDACDENKGLAIVCCGPPSFVDIVRNNTAKQVLKHPNKAIQYFEEFQCW